MANYINNREFHNCLVQYKKDSDLAEQQGKIRPQLPKYYADAITSIANRYASKPCFSGYSYKDEMISDAIMTCIQYATKYDTTRAERLNQPPNPLAYFTQLVHNAFITRIHVEHKQQYVKAKTLTTQINYSTIDDDHDLDSFDSIVTTFERKQEEKRVKALERKKIRESEVEV